MNDNNIIQWKKIVELHKKTKKFFILSEEFGVSLEMFIQPIKELRDAYEHIIRAYDCYLNEDKPDEQYIEDNLRKAIGHEYRALFDVLDYLSISLRLRISELVKGYTYRELIKIYPGYKDISTDLIRISKRIAEIRSQKDIAKLDSEDTLVNDYEHIITDLFEYYHNISENL